ncbi:hypothetical protein NQ166_05875 [Microbacterium sp. zg.Y1090]|nr:MULTISPECIES: hypothetical protein [unclassified Microbacterium]MCR2812197.1 hypothetical protein [Microbacterium sp. zg.Y1084]MCR2818365.1 hypothetical protein [Microbacterium sp. zg.Y1090]MDL5486177.1 hypothetical protein [Microbacterium sp. zg-Y1211]WIM29384.1 hypothetical protein QNO26_05685 [Microbacterium sp. zg-Y1090]
MEYGFISHVLLWIIGIMTAAAGVGAVAALWSLGRQGYKQG